MLKKRKQGLKEFIEKQYEVSFDYIKESKNFIFFVVFLFFLFALVGFFVPLPSSISNEVLNYFKTLIGETKNLGLFGLIAFLFHNNALTGFMGLFSGVFFGVFPFFNTILNGFVLGFASRISVSQYGILSLWRLFPHGIFELPAIFISLGLGFKLSTFLLKEEKLKSLGEFFKKSASVYVFVVLPLLVIAAIIEGTLIYLGV